MDNESKTSQNPPVSPTVGATWQAESPLVQSIEVCFIDSGDVRPMQPKDTMILEDTVGTGVVRGELQYMGDEGIGIKPLSNGCLVNGSLLPIAEGDADKTYPVAPGAVIVVGAKRFQVRFKRSKAGQRRLPATPGLQTKSTLPRKRTRRHQKAVNMVQQPDQAQPTQDPAQPPTEQAVSRKETKRPQSRDSVDSARAQEPALNAASSSSPSKPSTPASIFSKDSVASTTQSSAGSKRKDSNASLGAWITDMFSVMIWDPTAEAEDEKSEESNLTEAADQVAEILTHQLIVSNPATASGLIDRVFRALEDAVVSHETAVMAFLQGWKAGEDSAENMNALLALIESLMSTSMEDVDTWLGALLLLQSRFLEVPGVAVPKSLVGMTVGFLVTAESASILKLACKLIHEWSLQDVHIPNGTGDILCVVLRTNDSNPDVATIVCELLVSLVSLHPELEASRESMQRQTAPILMALMKAYPQHGELHKWAKLWLTKKQEKKKKAKVPESASAGNLTAMQGSGTGTPAEQPSGAISPSASMPNMAEHPVTGRGRAAQLNAQPSKPRRSLPTVPSKKPASEDSTAAKEVAIPFQAQAAETNSPRMTSDKAEHLDEQATQKSSSDKRAMPEPIRTDTAPQTLPKHLKESGPSSTQEPVPQIATTMPGPGTAHVHETKCAEQPQDSQHQHQDVGTLEDEAAQATSTNSPTCTSKRGSEDSVPNENDTQLNTGSTAVESTSIAADGQVTVENTTAEAGDESLIPESAEVEPTSTVAGDEEAVENTSAKPEHKPKAGGSHELELERPPKYTVLVEDEPLQAHVEETEKKAEEKEETADPEPSAAQNQPTPTNEGMLTPGSRRRNQWASVSPSPAGTPLSPRSPLAPLSFKTHQLEEEEAGLQEVEAEHEDVANCLSRRTMGVRLAKQRWDTGEMMMAVRTAFQLHADADVAGYLDVLSMLLKQIYRWPHEVIVEAMTSLGALNLTTLSPKHVELACSLMTVLSERLLVPADKDATDSAEDEFLSCLSSALGTTEDFFSRHTDTPDEQSEWRKAWLSVHALNQRLNLGTL
ncbi:uncharacterized protein LOC135808789 [Sycon ciliatum]|uniref:uncharacterized protein LOC135808789 n=1 Tax=Sycon ciliatum TaxID=27933 RepID=UPI0031F67BAC